MLRPFGQYEWFDWAPLNSTRELRRQHIKLYCMKRSAYYLLGHVRHQFADEFCIPTPPPADMGSKASSHALAPSIAAEACAHRSRITLHEVCYEEYLGWFEQIGKPHFYEEELRESQRGMWFGSEWAKVR